MNNISIGICVSLLLFLTNDMTTKFLAGFITGIFVSTKYDFKPYVNLIEDKLTNLHKELEQKREEIHQHEQEMQQHRYEKPRMADNNWPFNWPWSTESSSPSSNSKKN